MLLSAALRCDQAELTRKYCQVHNSGTKSPDAHLLTDKTGNALRTDRTYDKAKLTSELNDDVFAQLEQLEVTGVGGSVNFKTSGFARYTTKGSRCGSVVVVCKPPLRVPHLSVPGVGCLAS